MPKLKEININYEQIKDLFSQLDFEKKMALIREVTKEREYKKNFYEYTEKLVKKYNISKMSEEELDALLHDKNWRRLNFLISKVVIDTNIYISAIFWGGNPREVVDLGRDEKILIFTSLEIENEIAEKLRTKFKLDEDDINHILLDFSTFTIPIKVTKHIEAVPDDQDDNKFIECAVKCNADYIVSGDRHLLKLKEYAGIRILKASEFLSILSKK